MLACWESVDAIVVMRDDNTAVCQQDVTMNNFVCLSLMYV